MAVTSLNQNSRVLLPNHGSAAKELVLQALGTAISLAKKLKKKEIALVVPAKGNLDHTMFGEVLTREQCSKLSKGQTISINGSFGNFSLFCESLTTLSSRAEIVMAFYLSADDVDKVTTSFPVRAIVFVPWLTEEGSAWYNTWNPVVIGDPPAKTAVPIHTEIEQELRTLTGIINPSTGLGHPNDKRDAKEMFKRLRKKNIQIEPEAIYRWTLQNGWRAQFARDLESLAVTFQ